MQIYKVKEFISEHDLFSFPHNSCFTFRLNPAAMDKLALLLMLCAGAGASSNGDSSTKSLQRFCCNDGQNWLAGSRVNFLTLDICLTM